VTYFVFFPEVFTSRSFAEACLKKISMSQPDEFANIAIRGHLQILRTDAQCPTQTRTGEVAG
jgi:hypothetical protein